VEPTAQAFSDIDNQTLIAAQQAVSRDLARHPDPARWGQSIVSSGLALLPVLDGDLITRRPIDAVAEGAGDKVAMMVGTNSEEWRFVLVPLGLIATVTPKALPARMTRRGWGPTIGKAYAANRPGASVGEVFAAVITDSQFWMPAVRLAEARVKAGAAATYVYEFAWRTTVRQFGACHMLEIPFVFDTLAEPTGHSLVGVSPPQELAERVHAGWAAFARDGNPGWRPYDLERRAVMTFDHPGSGLVEDPRSNERERWNGVI